MRWCGWTFVNHCQFTPLLLDLRLNSAFRQNEINLNHDKYFFWSKKKIAPTLLIHQLVFFRRIDNALNS